MAGLVLFLHLILSCWMHLAASENSSVIYTPTVAGQQHVLSGTGFEDLEPQSYGRYQKLSIKQELEKRLSPRSSIHLEGEADFAALAARYTEYKRPQYIAAVRVAEEQDVIETVEFVH
jgi:hypothetical protein